MQQQSNTHEPSRSKLPPRAQSDTNLLISSMQPRALPTAAAALKQPKSVQVREPLPLPAAPPPSPAMMHRMSPSRSRHAAITGHHLSDAGAVDFTTLNNTTSSTPAGAALASNATSFLSPDIRSPTAERSHFVAGDAAQREQAFLVGGSNNNLINMPSPRSEHNMLPSDWKSSTARHGWPTNVSTIPQMPATTTVQKSTMSTLTRSRAHLVINNNHHDLMQRHDEFNSINNATSNFAGGASLLYGGGGGGRRETNLGGLWRTSPKSWMGKFRLKLSYGVRLLMDIPNRNEFDERLMANNHNAIPSSINVNNSRKSSIWRQIFLIVLLFVPIFICVCVGVGKFGYGTFSLARRSLHYQHVSDAKSYIEIIARLREERSAYGQFVLLGPPASRDAYIGAQWGVRRAISAYNNPNMSMPLWPPLAVGLNVAQYFGLPTSIGTSASSGNTVAARDLRQSTADALQAYELINTNFDDQLALVRKQNAAALAENVFVSLEALDWLRQYIRMSEYLMAIVDYLLVGKNYDSVDSPSGQAIMGLVFALKARDYADTEALLSKFFSPSRSWRSKNVPDSGNVPSTMSAAAALLNEAHYAAQQAFQAVAISERLGSAAHRAGSNTMETTQTLTFRMFETINLWSQLYHQSRYSKRIPTEKDLLCACAVNRSTVKQHSDFLDGTVIGMLDDVLESESSKVFDGEHYSALTKTQQLSIVEYVFLAILPIIVSLACAAVVTSEFALARNYGVIQLFVFIRKFTERQRYLTELRRAMENVRVIELPDDFKYKLGLLGMPIVPERFDSVTCLLMRICDFDEIVRQSTPVQIVGFMTQISKLTKHTVEKYDAFKLRGALSDALVVSGIPGRNGDQHAEELCNVALDLLSNFHDFTVSYLLKNDGGKWRSILVNVSIAVHTGVAVAGVAHQQMYPLYLVFGEALQTVSKVLLKAEPRLAHVTSTTRRILKESFPHFITNTHSTIRNQKHSALNIYFLVGNDVTNVKFRIADELVRYTENIMTDPLIANYETMKRQLLDPNQNMDVGTADLFAPKPSDKKR